MHYVAKLHQNETQVDYVQVGPRGGGSSCLSLPEGHHGPRRHLEHQPSGEVGQEATCSTFCNAQNFIMEAYADPLKYYEPDPPNTTDPKEVADRLADNDEEVKMMKEMK